MGGTLMRLLTGGMSPEVLYCWAACTPIVVLGAPLGSLLLKPKMTELLRRCFYVLALVQLVSFGILKVQGNFLAWMCVLGTLLAVALGLALHYVLVVRRHVPASEEREVEMGSAAPSSANSQDAHTTYF